ncbi:Immunoglobulin E-set [Penicillium coprophilum]|uniref:Immunoglobulin E-set n=1 Tax=Penicillium coprophilum TaxID=36646 RepID=UPI0023A70366|nr:Immunoglobulin E-set [Penicillium coprophilum]KAJ5158428.1 Immunoglobulin E-set [Penicillium coprophilum]
MGTFTFKWPHNASEVFVTGTFDDWGKTVKLDRVGDIFTKEVTISPVQKVQYKFVVDGIWTTDPNVREEEDGHNNINNVLLPEEIHSDFAPTMSGVTPDSTTAALAANVPKEPNGHLPGTFPETPGLDSEQTLSVDPIPASEGYGNPVSLNPGDKVPHHSTLHNNTVDSTVTLDKESYEKGQTLPIDGLHNTDANPGSAPYTLPPITNNMIPESSLPIGGPAQHAAVSESEPTYTGAPVEQATLADPGYNIQSAGPNSTTAALAAAVPLEPKGKETNGDKPVDEVPQVVKDSMAEAHKDPEAAANQEAVDEKKAIEAELHKKVQVEESAGAPAPTVTAATQAVAPHLTAGGVDSADVSPLSTPPPGRTFAAADPAAPTSAPKTESSGPTVTTGPETTSTAEVSTPKAEPAAPTVTTGVESSQAPATSTPATSTAKPAEQSRKQSHSEGASTIGEKKKKHRMSSFFGKLKEKLK